MDAASHGEEIYDHARLLMGLAGALALLVVIGAVAMVMLLVSRRLRRLEARMATLAEKDYDAAVPYTGAGDEIGAMARALLVFRDGLKEADRLHDEQVAAQRRRTAEIRTQLERERRSEEHTSELQSL